MSSLFYFLCGFAIFFLIFWSGKWVVHILAISYGKYKLHRKVSNLPRDTPLPSVSILKPLMGVDPNLSHNLETFFTMNYPIYELLFCVEDKNDPAVEIVQQLREKYPYIESSLFLGGSNVGVNPKINNMHPGYQAAKYELIMISDSGIKMKEDTLLDMVENMTEKVGLVHQMPFTCDRDGFAATFEKIFFGTIQSRIYLCADLLGINCHTGMSCLMRKPVIDKLGGLSKFGCYLAEDFFLAKSLTESGWKMRISSQPAWQNSGICDLQNFQARLCRWAKLRVAMMPTTILLEPLSECLVVGAFASWSVGLLFCWDPLVFYLIHILMWFLSDWILLSIVQNGTLSFNKFEFVVGWIFREISGPYLFFNALYDPAIRWRTRLYKLQWGGIAYELQENKTNETTSSPNNKISFDNDLSRTNQKNLATNDPDNYKKSFNNSYNRQQQQQQQQHQQLQLLQQEGEHEKQPFLINQLEKQQQQNNCGEQQIHLETNEIIEKQSNIISSTPVKQLQQHQQQQQQYLLHEYQQIKTQQQQYSHNNKRSQDYQHQINQITANLKNDLAFSFCKIKNNNNIYKDPFYREGIITNSLIKPTINDSSNSINNCINNVNCNNCKYDSNFKNNNIINTYDNKIENSFRLNNNENYNIIINNSSYNNNNNSNNNNNKNSNININNGNIDGKIFISNSYKIEKSDNNIIENSHNTKSDSNSNNSKNKNNSNNVDVNINNDN
ncbi:ceramide glucosyltransferase [Condylostylus longicornis]|uniref:ceramide glucosyltransferase n=1 Tax=Condylostylus longicornis TaxID=2530218 RepID=UPI00244DF180|nr:ceramide glucosyltransferase [Condylostylus longicornis]